MFCVLQRHRNGCGYGTDENKLQLLRDKRYMCVVQQAQMYQLYNLGANSQKTGKMFAIG